MIIQTFTCCKLDRFQWGNLKAVILHVLTPDIFRGYDFWHTTDWIWCRFLDFWLNVFFLAWNSIWPKMNSSSFKLNIIFLTFAVYTIARISWFASTREGTLGVGAVCIIVAVVLSTFTLVYKSASRVTSNNFFLFLPKLVFTLASHFKLLNSCFD